MHLKTMRETMKDKNPAGSLKDKNPAGSLKDNKESMNRLKANKDVKDESGPKTHMTSYMIYMSSDRFCNECRRMSRYCECYKKTKWYREEQMKKFLEGKKKEVKNG